MTLQEQEAHRDRVLTEFKDKLLRHVNVSGTFRIDPNKFVHFPVDESTYHFIVQIEKDNDWLDFSRGTIDEINLFLRQVK